MDNKIESLYLKYEREKDEKERLAQIAEIESNIECFLQYVKTNFSGLDARSLSYCLSVLCKKSKYRESIKRCLTAGNNAVLLYLSQSTDAKTRKNVYIVLGNIKSPDCFFVLENASRTEKTLFNVPSLILALGNYEKEQALNPINTIKAYCDGIEIPDKIKAEINAAFAKALDRLSDKKRGCFTGFTKPRQFLLTAMPGQKRILKNDISQLFSRDVELQEGYVITTNDVAKIFTVRTFYECYLYSSSVYDVAFDERALQNLRRFIDTTDLLAAHGNTDKLNYRITVGGTTNKKSIVEQINNSITEKFKDKLINSPSNYSVEIIINFVKGNARCFVKLHSLCDSRFSYRTEFIPASINPVTAAVICKIAFEYIKTPDTVLDPFCGTSTILIEAGKIMPKAKLCGIDTALDAIKKSRINICNAGMKASLIHGNSLTHPFTAKFDAVISNMPFGSRVGTHKNNEKLYSAFFGKLPHILAGNGFAFLYTVEIDLVKKLIKQNGNLQLVATHKMQSGGLYPTLFVVQLTGV